MNEESLFIEALEIRDPAARSAYLDRACAGDAVVRGRLERLLDQHDRAGSFLGRPAVGLAETASLAAGGEATGTHLLAGSGELVGTTIGAYKLLQQLGEGGMGTVFMAEQTHPVQRKVALKLIKAGMDSRQVLARFEAERQALALMDHPNIARVLDAGTTDRGLPYFVMELVKGVPITRYCDDHHLTCEERLGLFVSVCHAVQHAHQKGIIHRDLKPSNVMVCLYDGKPVPKVIDFGVAKATGQKLTDKTLFTEYGSVVGTLEYMSPEQAEVNQLDVDTRSDVYSLGVLLYELLTGTTPLERKRFQEVTFLEVLRLIREEDPPRPSTRLSALEGLPSIAANSGLEPKRLGGLVRGELDWIAMRALEKDRARRYETANGLAADVQRYLNDETVQACPPSAGYRLRKFARRNKRRVAGLAVVGVAVLISAATLGWAIRDRQAREKEVAQDKSRKLTLTEQSIRQALERATKSRAELQAMLKSPGGVQRLLNQPARWELLMKTAQGELAQAQHEAIRADGGSDAAWSTAMDQLEQQITNDQGDHDQALRLERIRQDKATWVEGKFDLRKADDEYTRAFAGLGVLDADAEYPAARIAASPINEQLVASLDDWALVAFARQDHTRAQRIMLVARLAASDPAWGDQIRRIDNWQDPNVFGRLVVIAPPNVLSPQLLNLVGSVLTNTESPMKETWLRQAQAEHPADFWLNYNLGRELLRSSPVEAEGFCRVALAVRPGSSMALNLLGSAFSHQKKMPEAIAMYRKAIELDAKHPLVLTNLGRALKVQGKVPEAIAAFQGAIDADPRYAQPHYDLGRTLYDEKRLPEAIAAFHKATEIDPAFAKAYFGLGNALHYQKKVPEAVDAFCQAIKHDPAYGAAHLNLADLLRVSGKVDDAVLLYRKAVQLIPKNSRAHSGLAFALTVQRNLEEAIVHYRKALELDSNDALTHGGLGTALFHQGKLDEAIACYRKSIELNPKEARSHNGLAWILTTRPQVELRDPKLALDSARRAVDLCRGTARTGRHSFTRSTARGTGNRPSTLQQKLKEMGSPDDGLEWFLLSMAHWQLGNGDTAHEWYEQAVRWMDKNDPKNEYLLALRVEASKLLRLDKQKE